MCFDHFRELEPSRLGLFTLQCVKAPCLWVWVCFAGAFTVYYTDPWLVTEQKEKSIRLRRSSRVKKHYTQFKPSHLTHLNNTYTDAHILLEECVSEAKYMLYCCCIQRGSSRVTFSSGMQRARCFFEASATQTSNRQLSLKSGSK